MTLIWKGGSKTFGSYIPPDNSPYFNPVKFCHTANNFTPLDSDHIVIGGRDVNSRVGNNHRFNLLLLDDTTKTTSIKLLTVIVEKLEIFSVLTTVTKSTIS